MITSEVKINDDTVIRWSAANEGNGDKEGTSIYAVYASGRSHRGRSFNFKFDVIHFRNDGPAILAAIIFNEIDERITWRDADLIAALTD